MIEPITCVPKAALTSPAATAAAEPLLDPPGVRARSQGLRVPRGSVAANSVVTVFPRMTAPASRKAATAAASRPEHQPSNNGEPIPVGSLDDVLDANRHAVDCRQWFVVTPAPGRRIGGSSRPIEIGMNKRADLRFPHGKRIEAALEVGARRVISASELRSGVKKRLRLRHGRDIGGQHRQSFLSVMAPTR